MVIIEFEQLKITLFRRPPQVRSSKAQIQVKMSPIFGDLVVLLLIVHLNQPKDTLRVQLLDAIKTKRAPAYCPFFCTVAQTGQFFDVHHRPGNVQDSNCANQSMLDCFSEAKKQQKGALHFLDVLQKAA